MNKLNFSTENMPKRYIAELQTVLEKLDLKVALEEKTAKRIGQTTTRAIEQIQKRNNVTTSGKLDNKTIEVINAELFDIHHTQSKVRTEKLHTLLEKAGISLPSEEKKNRIAGEATREAIKKFQTNNRLKTDGRLNETVLERLHEEVIKKTYSTKTQVGKLHTTLLKVNSIAKLDVEIPSGELKEKKLGPASVTLIKEFQKKYKLPETGELNKPTLDKLTSVAAGRGTFVKKLKRSSCKDLKTVTKPLRLNMVSPNVAQMQKNLTFLGYKISENEYKTQTFGKTTIKALKVLQKEKGLTQTGHYDKATSHIVNAMIATANPRAVTQHRYRIRGSVRNELWERKNNMVIKIFLNDMDQDGIEPIGAKKVFLNGFFDIPFDAPINPVNGKVKDNFHLSIKLYELNDQQNPVAEQIHYKVNRIHWVNFVQSRNEKGEIGYNGKYAGESDYVITGAILQKTIGRKKIDELNETETDRQITSLSFRTGLSTDDIMCHVLAHLVAKSVNTATLDDEVFYGFIRQNLPADLPGDLLRGASEWETIDYLTELTSSGIIFFDNATQEQAIDNAIAQNIVSQKVKVNKKNILEELQNQRKNFTLTKPILVGNGDLKSLLAQSGINPAHYSTIATVFVNNKGINTSFWNEIKGHETEIGADAIKDFACTVEIGNLTKNHMPTIIFLKGKIGIGPDKSFKKTGDIAKLSQEELENLIKENKSQVPENMPGDSVDEKVGNYAAAIKSRAEYLYPSASLIGAIKKTPKLTMVQEIETFVDTYEDFNLREHNVDKYLNDHPEIPIAAKTKEELKVVQRVHKITTKSVAGSALVNAGLHSSMQIYFIGRDRLTTIMKDSGVDTKDIYHLYESSKMNYMQVLARLMDYRRELYRDMPRVIIPHTYTKKEIQEAIGDIPDLETLFGSLDYCECPHCKSLYSPSAYLTDMLRFLNEHLDINNDKTVKEILFERRPDLGNIKLSCINTDTPLPYIDLVCEILENNIVGNRNFVYQTTLSQKELRAVPEYIQSDAYKKIADADFPMNYSFNLWQEESRMYLNYLQAPRYQLMETFQDSSNPDSKKPSDAAIAAEYFGISSKERTLIVTKHTNAVAQKKYWGFTAAPTSMSVDLFMRRSKLSYTEVLELLLVKWINNHPQSSSAIKIERPVDTCDTSVQSIVNLTFSKFDQIHRFIRLWRKTGWAMWELDLLIRNETIGANVINDITLINLKRFRLLQEKLKLPFETLLAFFGDINREVRIVPDKPDVLLQPLYNKLFQNQAVNNPLDKNFEALDDNNNPKSLNSAIVLEVNTDAPFDGYTPVPTILSALALQQTDFDILVKKTNKLLSVSTLSMILRYAYLARALKLSVTELCLFLDSINCSDPFSSIQTLLDNIKHLECIRSSGLSINELDYILNYKPESPAGLRVESIVQFIESLRKILQSNKEKIEQLHLSEVDRKYLLAFDTASLSAMNNASLITALTPLKAILVSAIENFTAAAFSIQETNFILDFGTSAITTAGREKLAVHIGMLQQNLSFLLCQNKNQIKSHIASTFGFKDEQTTSVLENCTVPGSTASLLPALENEGLITKNTAGDYPEINATNFPDHFTIYSLLHKISLLVLKMHIETNDLEFFIKNYTGLNTLNFSALPVAITNIPNQYNKWHNLYLFLSFKAKCPEPENVSIRSILTLAQDSNRAKEDIFAEIAKLTQWDADEIASLHTRLNLQHSTSNLDYTNAKVYGRLIECFRLMKLAGANAATMFGWSVISTGATSEKNISAQIRMAVKSKYEQDDWLEKVTPLHDVIREKKRTALVGYILDNSQRTIDPEVKNGVITNPLYWEDSNSLYKYFLIDVEMCALQLTSRIKQAISSIQLFVQRCFLNLENRYVKVTQNEKEDRSSPNAWSQWKWMKNYRIWEANRKIFFYPENWLEPELRDDKSPFFKELENELMQNEVTKENVEQAFQNYLHKVDEVSHLEVCGMYHQMEDLNPDEAGYETNIVHVIGRTRAIPNIYYYRAYDMNYSTWSSWEKIDVDINGDHVTPVVYNRKLHLFWLQFMEKPMKTNKVPAAKPSSGPTVAPEPQKMLEIQLGWSVKKTGGWTTKKISKQKLIHPWERPHFSYNLKPYYLSRFNELYMDVYLSTTNEFNNTKFYDPNVPVEQNPVYLTANRFNETYLPWHSSSFIFDGEVKDVKLKGLGGHFDFLGIDLWLEDSYDYVHEHFGEDGKKIKELDPIYEYGPRLKLPGGMHFHNNRLVNNRTHSKNDRYLNVLENAATTTLLSGANTPFELVISQQDLQLDTVAASHPFFYQDNQRTFFVKPEWETRLNNYGQLISKNRKYRFMPFYHPYTTLFLRELNRNGIDGIINRKIQIRPESFAPINDFSFSSYSPESNVIAGSEESDSQKKKDIVDFSFGSAHSVYNWELFFHAPLMVACRLMQNQKFEDAMNWFHYIFNPTNIDDCPVPRRYWITKPFFNYNSDDYRNQRIQSILSNLNLKENEAQLKAWRNNPFKPHVVARYRPVAYQKNVVMKYLDNIISWGDMLFKRDTIESINEASLLYMLAYEILGDRPQRIPNVRHEELTYNELETKLDAFGNARVDVLLEDTLLPITVIPSSTDSETVPKLETFYFGIPNNEYLSKYWDTVEDRLFKIRHCMNIQGVVRQLPLFEPPIDPALLVKAAAAGMDLNSVLNDVSAPTPYYRFKIVMQKAIEFCNEVKALGEKLLSALEKKDTEGIALLRSQHEIKLLEAVKEIRKKQIDEAVETIGGMNKSFAMAEEKKNYYENKEFMNTAEVVALGLSSASLVLDACIAAGYIISGGLKLIPDFLAGASGFGGSPQVDATMGGQQIGNAAEMAVRTIQAIATTLDKAAALSTTVGSYQHRKDDWDFQGRLANIEMDQIQFQINAAMIRQAIAEKELQNQELLIDNAKTVDDYMRNKFSNEQLYSWMITQISTVYFQAYQLAFDMAKKAEKCYQYELGIVNSNIVQFGYWDSLKKGLLSGDKLMNDLRKLEAEYLNQNRREFEITKHISLAQMAPLSFITLKETGVCSISLPEWFFDMDYPGHYMRRIKNVSISIPCITGPFTGVNCTLSLLKNETRLVSTLSGGNYEKQEDDTRFRTMYGEISSIATSHAQNDSGMFELNFNDERYLPFEGAGVISDWQISMPIENNYFDFASLSDVILHIRYTSRAGGGELTSTANENMRTKLPNETARLFSIRHEFSSEWHRFLNPNESNDQELVIQLKKEHYPFFVRGKIEEMKIRQMDVFIESSISGGFISNIKATTATSLDGLSIDKDMNVNGIHHLSRSFTSGSQPDALGEVRMKMKISSAADFKTLSSGQIDNIFILFQLER
jgi:peptidoglycan hydrolase-like protein with peptidoglycan-binding domain